MAIPLCKRPSACHVSNEIAQSLQRLSLLCSAHAHCRRIDICLVSLCFTLALLAMWQMSTQRTSITFHDALVRNLLLYPPVDATQTCCRGQPVVQDCMTALCHASCLRACALPSASSGPRPMLAVPNGHGIVPRVVDSARSSHMTLPKS